MDNHTEQEQDYQVQDITSIPEIKDIYVIYHIPSRRKIGCTTNLKKRMITHQTKDFQILEVHVDRDVASRREQLLQKRYGYTVDRCAYNQQPGFESKSKGGIKGGEATRKLYGKKIECFTKQGIPVGRFESINHAATELNLNPGNILKQVRKEIKQTGGYTFGFIEEGT